MRTFPRARRAPSKKSMTPSIMKNTPNEVSPTPISMRCSNLDDERVFSVRVRKGKVFFFY
jgi:hypothetical protein